MKIFGKVVVVTGAGSGIGRELVLHLLERGARVVGIDINPASLQETAEQAGERGPNLFCMVVDISDEPAVAALPQKAIDRFGEVDAVINNAGVIQPFVKLENLAYPTIQRIMNVNFFGALYMTKTFLPHLLLRGEGHIVNVASMGGLVPVPGQTIYGAAKAAVKLMTEGLAAELIATQVKVSVVIPGAVATNIMANSGLKEPASADGHEAGRRRGQKALTPSEAARIIVRGIERDDPYIFVGKDAKLADKFYRLSPSFAARTIAKKMSFLVTDQASRR